MATPPAHFAWSADPIARARARFARHRHRVAVAAVAALILAGWWSVADVVFVPTAGHVLRAPPQVTSGDEPHYLLVADSILFDHDLSLAEDYTRVRAGGGDAGVRYAGFNLDHHTYVVERDRTRLWSDVYDWQHSIACTGAPCVGYALRAGVPPPVPPVVERSAHPPALALLTAIALAPFCSSPRQVEAATPLVIVFFAWMAACASFVVARRSGLDRAPAAAAALLLAVASPWLAYSRSYFTEVPIGASLVLALLALQARRPIVAGLLIGVATALKPPFGLIGAAWIVERWFSGDRRHAWLLTAALAVVVAALCAFNWQQTGVLVISGQSAFHVVTRARQLGATLFDHRYGLFVFVPWAPLAFVGVAVRARHDPLSRQIALAVGFMLPLFMIDDALGATCYGCRYWVPLLPLLAIGVCAAAARAGTLTRASLAALALVGALIAVPGALLYHVAWDCGPYVPLDRLLARL